VKQGRWGKEEGEEKEERRKEKQIGERRRRMEKGGRRKEEGEGGENDFVKWRNKSRNSISVQILNEEQTTYGIWIRLRGISKNDQAVKGIDGNI
jgi:hypothetical protein